ncbi:hypothetical protein B0H66DRAFT_384718 [Apodospora peruviana]|uniref:DUF1748-domain-containing protein n=1 Tax=Apodospora peruviana TaxID=516989 RepID=A0AAE0HW52_9PEZI|nr:hypothetical protein B0H66DRAFT_384718 [Apodospora peruviana]
MFWQMARLPCDRLSCCARRPLPSPTRSFQHPKTKVRQDNTTAFPHITSLCVRRFRKPILFSLPNYPKRNRSRWLTHYAFDAVLFSAFLAGMKRSTGLTIKTDKIAGENKEVSKWVDKYLGVGEFVMDQAVAIAGSSGWFERTR